MPHTPPISLPWSPHPNTTSRMSFASRVSGFFGGRNENRNTTTASGTYPMTRETTTFEVPLFLSPARYDPTRSPAQMSHAQAAHSQQSLNQSFDAPWLPVRPSSSHYSDTRVSSSSQSLPTLLHQETPSVSVTGSTAASSKPRRPRRTQQQYGVKRRKKVSTRQQIQTAKHLSLAFGTTFLLAIVTYLVLAVTGIATGVMFHVLTILLTLILFGVCVHSSVRWVLLSRRRRNRKQRSQPREQRSGVRGGGGHDLEQGIVTVHDVESGDEIPEKPIQIIMKEDELVCGGGAVIAATTTEVQRPPPVYGNFRTSKKINPDLVHWQQVPPSPLTPTYAEAMNDVQRVVGYRPPSYAASDGGATQIVNTQRKDVEAVLHHIHPVHRGQNQQSIRI